MKFSLHWLWVSEEDVEIPGAKIKMEQLKKSKVNHLKIFWIWNISYLSEEKNPLKEM